METLNLETIRDGFPGLTPVIGEFLLEAAVVGLVENHHQSGVILNVRGDFTNEIKLQWSLSVSPQMKRSWKDLNEKTEYAASCIAVLLTDFLTEFTILEKASQGTGIDFWLIRKERMQTNPTDYTKDARLEISGLYSGTKQDISRRFKLKISQTQASDNLNIPAFICIVELGRPQAKLKEKVIQ